jgi:prepilin-type N-terminal cleavage/methylation domain-containing protein
MNNYNKGFSLIEVLITVAIIGILIAVGIPSYRKSQKLARRVECTSILSDCFKAQQLYYTQFEEYSRNFSDINNETFPPLTKKLFYDFALKAIDITWVVANQVLNYENKISPTGLSTPGNYTFITSQAVVTQPDGTSRFYCTCRGNIDGDADPDRIEVGEGNILYTRDDDI